MADLFTEMKKEVEWHTFLQKRRKKLNGRPFYRKEERS